MRHWNWKPRLNDDRKLMRAYDPQTRKKNREVGCLKRSRLRRWINKTIFSTSKQWRYWESNTGAQPPKFRPRWQIMLFESRHWERNKSAPALIVTRFIVLWLMEGGGGVVLWVAWWLWRCLWPSNSRAPGFAGDTECPDHQQWSGIVSAAENTKIQRSWWPSGKDTAAKILESMDLMENTKQSRNKKTGVASCTRIIKGEKGQWISFTLKLLKLHINHHSGPSVFCDSLKDFPYQVVVLKNSNILRFKLLKRSPSGVASWRGDTAVAQLKPAGNCCQPQYFIFQVVPASTRSSDHHHLEKWHSAAHLSPILVENNGRNRSCAPTLLPLCTNLRSI